MNTDEYEIMYRVEDRLWWYHGLRGMIRAFWPPNLTGEGIRVLDVGCGTGATLAMLAERATLFGIDFAPEAVHLCRRRGIAKTAVASANDLPFADSAFDVVVSCDVLCHKSISDKKQPLREMHRVLKPGGAVLLNLPAYQWLYSSHDTHVHTDHRFTRSEAQKLLNECGFVSVRASYWNTLLLPVILPTRLWRKVRPLEASDLSNEPGHVANSLLKKMLDLERWIATRTGCNVGLSVIVSAKRKS